jgi:hypothetical protein
MSTGRRLSAVALERWRARPMTFIEEVLHDPETGKPFKLLEAERRVLEHAFVTIRELVVTYAGFSGESTLLEELRARGLKQPAVGPDLHAGDGLLMFWSHEPVAPWQTREWVEQMRSTLRPSAFLRQIRNEFVTSESSFIPLEWWDECVDAATAPIFTDRGLRIWVGVDASVKRDSTAIVAVTWDDRIKKAKLVNVRVFQPSADEPLDFEATVERTVLALAQHFNVQEVRYDPYQMTSTAQRLASKRVNMVEFPQTMGNLTAASDNLYELIKGRNLGRWYAVGDKSCRCG